jgi:hypothetical protein
MSIHVYPKPPVIVGGQPISTSSTPVAEFYASVAAGNVPGHSIMNAMGERESIGTTVTGEDIWRGAATEVPVPADAGVQMEVVSDDVQDTSAGTGVQTLRIEYLDASGNEQTEDVTMNGTTGVALVETNVRFVNDMYALTVGSNGVAEGDIDIYLQSASTTIYNMIYAGGNKSLVPHRMVPLAKTLILKEWNATEAQAKRIAFRIRSTDMNSVLLPGVFCFKDTAYINNATTGQLPLNINVPALSIVKVSGWAVVMGAEGSCSWWGLLIDD